MTTGVRRPNPREQLPAIRPRPDDPNRPFWSVMIPSYNSGALLARTIESVLAQDPGPATMQIEVVDDHSTEHPGPFVEQISAGRVGVFRQPTNVGAAGNFTTCADRARGRWVHILHSDDVVRPDFYGRYRERIATCPEAVLVAAQTFTADSSEHLIGLTPALVATDGYLLDAAFTIATQHPLAAASVVVARRAYEAVGGFHPALPHTNDWEMWTRLAVFGRVAWVDEPLALYRAHENSDSNRVHRTTAYLDECLRAVDGFAEYFEPQRRDAVRRGARHAISRYATAVGHEMIGQHHRRLAVANAVRGVRLDPTIPTTARAMEVVALAVAAATRDRVDMLKRSTTKRTT
jgi:hypothetical protein